MLVGSLLRTKPLAFFCLKIHNHITVKCHNHISTCKTVIPNIAQSKGLPGSTLTHHCCNYVLCVLCAKWVSLALAMLIGVQELCSQLWQVVLSQTVCHCCSLALWLRSCVLCVTELASCCTATASEIVSLEHSVLLSRVTLATLTSHSHVGRHLTLSWRT